MKKNNDELNILIRKFINSGRAPRVATLLAIEKIESENKQSNNTELKSKAKSKGKK